MIPVIRSLCSVDLDKFPFVEEAHVTSKSHKESACFMALLLMLAAVSTYVLTLDDQLYRAETRDQRRRTLQPLSSGAGHRQARCRI
jgi:hypothetical protein